MATKIRHMKLVPSKLDIILKHLRHKNGASLTALEKATGWQPHSVRAALTRLRKKGNIIDRDKNAKGIMIYKIAKVAD